MNSERRGPILRRYSQRRRDLFELVLCDRSYRGVFWVWFVLVISVTTACLGGNRALPEFLLALMILMMTAVWALRVVRTGGPTALGPRTPHLIAACLLVWTTVSIIPLDADVTARLSTWSAWARNLDREVTETLGAPAPMPTSALSIDPASSRHDLRRLAAYYLFFVLTLVHLSRPRDVRRVLRIIVVVACAEAVVGALGVMTGFSPASTVHPGFVGRNQRYFGTFVNPSHAGTLLGVGLTLWIPLACLSISGYTHSGSRQSGTSIGLVGQAIIGAALLLGLLLTGSHGAMLATGMTVAVMGAWCVIRLPHARRLLAATVATAVVGGLVAMVFLPAVERDAHASKLSQRYRWLTGERPLLRWQVWKGAWAAASVAPWIGAGPGTFVDAYRPFDVTRKETLFSSAHNTYLDVLVERGIVGTGIGVLVIGWLICALRPRRPRSPREPGSARTTHPRPKPSTLIRLGLGGSLSVLLLHAVVDSSAKIPAIALVFVTLAAALIRSAPTWKRHPAGILRRRILPWVAPTAAAILVAAHSRPLTAAGLFGRAVRLNQRLAEHTHSHGDAASGSPAGTVRRTDLPGSIVTEQPGRRICDCRESEAVLRRSMGDVGAMHTLLAYDSHGATYALALRQRALERYGVGADILLQDAIELTRQCPFRPEARLAAAAAAAHLGETRAAVAFAWQARSIDRGHAETSYAAGRALLDAGAERPAVIAFADSLDTSPRFVFEIARMVHDRRLERFMLGLSIDEPRSLCWLVMSLPRVDDNWKRRVAGRLASMIDNEVHRLTLAERLYIRGQSALWLEKRAGAAVRWFEDSLAIEPSTWIRWHLAQAYRLSGRSDDAEAILQAIDESEPGYIPYEYRTLNHVDESTRNLADPDPPVVVP